MVQTFYNVSIPAGPVLGCPLTGSQPGPGPLMRNMTLDERIQYVLHVTDAEVTDRVPNVKIRVKNLDNMAYTMLLGRREAKLKISSLQTRMGTIRSNMELLEDTLCNREILQIQMQLIDELAPCNRDRSKAARKKNMAAVFDRLQAEAVDLILTKQAMNRRYKDLRRMAHDLKTGVRFAFINIYLQDPFSPADMAEALELKNHVTFGTMPSVDPDEAELAAAWAELGGDDGDTLWGYGLGHGLGHGSGDILLGYSLGYGSGDSLSGTRICGDASGVSHLGGHGLGHGLGHEFGDSVSGTRIWGGASRGTLLGSRIWGDASGDPH